MYDKVNFSKIMELPFLIFLNYTKGMLENHDALYDNLNLSLRYSMDQYNHMFIVLLHIQNVLQEHEQLQDEVLLIGKQLKVDKLLHLFPNTLELLSQ